MTALNSAYLQVDCLGQVIELAPVGHVLFKLLSQADIQLFCPEQLLQIETHQARQQLTLASGKVINAQLLIAADGVNSVVRQQLGLTLEQTDFGQVGLIANVALDRPHQQQAYERFTEHGPLAMLPMQTLNLQHRMSMVWAMTAAKAAQLKQASEVEFLAELQQQFGYQAGRFIGVGERHQYPLNLCVMPRPIYHRTLFIGNAAQMLHPIAGQGFNLGLRDVVGLLKVLKQHLDSGYHIGDIRLQHSYLNNRQTDRDNTINAINGLVRGFSNQYWPLVAGRSIGLRLLSWLPPLKYPVAERAMGWQ